MLSAGLHCHNESIINKYEKQFVSHISNGALSQAVSIYIYSRTRLW